jgi:hypothetical protein
MPAGPAPDNRDLLASLVGVDLRRDPAFFPALVDDGAFDRLDGHRGVDNVDRAAGLARGGTDAAGEFGEVVGGVKVLQRLQPIALVDEIVPVGDLVVHRAAVVAVGHAAIHAACRLLAGAGIAERNDELVVVLQPLRDGTILAILAVDFEEACDLAHIQLLPGDGAPAAVLMFPAASLTQAAPSM